MYDRHKDLTIGINLIFAPKSHKHIGNLLVPIMHGIVKLPGSFNLVGILREMIELQVSVKGTVSCSFQRRLFVIRSFQNIAYLGI